MSPIHLITRDVPYSNTFGKKTVLKTFLANIVLADNIEESVEDITAALTAPKPKKATAGGVKYCRQRRNTNFVSSSLQTSGLFGSHRSPGRLPVTLLK